MAIHILKTWPQYFASIVRGEKNFEIRKNDRDFKVGDILCLKEFIPSNESYTNRVWVVIITYILKGGECFGIDPSFCVLGILQLSMEELGLKENL